MKKIIVNLKDYLGYRENVEFANQSEGLDITVFPSLTIANVKKMKIDLEKKLEWHIAMI